MNKKEELLSSLKNGAIEGNKRLNAMRITQEPG